MKNFKKTLISLFISLLFINTIIYTVYAQENKSNITQNATFSEGLSKSEVTQDNSIIEAQRSLDRSLSILNIVATLIGVLVGLITIIVVIAIAVGIFEYGKWKAIRNDIEKEANIIRGIRNNVENDSDIIRSEIAKLSHEPLIQKPSDELREKMDELSHKLEHLEMLGASLEPEDYLSRGIDLFYKGKYELSIKAFEKVIELEPNFAEAWYNKGSALDRLKRYEEALKAIEKAIEINPNDSAAWVIKGAVLCHLNRYDDLIEASEKAIEINPKAAGGWYNRACGYSIKGIKEKVISDLKKAIELEIDRKEKAKIDKDFEKFWDDKDFKELVD